MPAPPSFAPEATLTSPVPLLAPWMMSGPGAGVGALAEVSAEDVERAGKGSHVADSQVYRAPRPGDIERAAAAQGAAASVLVVAISETGRAGDIDGIADTVVTLVSLIKSSPRQSESSDAERTGGS